MGWLAPGGTAYSYRMSIPVANPLPQGNRFLAVPFPAWYLRDKGKIAQSGYQDVHVTTSDGTTELACALNPAKTALLIDYEGMPQGRTTLYVYYGHTSASAPTAPTNVPEKGGTLVSAGFDLGAPGASMVSSPWSGSGTGSAVFDHTYPRRGEVAALDSLMELKLATTPGNYYILNETATDNLNTDGTEIRWWMYCDTTNKLRAVYDNDGGDAFSLYWAANGNIEVLTNRTKTGYNNGTNTTLVSYSTGWWQYKIIFNWTNQTFRFARRQRVCDAWTYLKASGAADYDIPMRNAGTTTDIGGTAFYVSDGANLWIDDFQYSTSGITDVSPWYYYNPSVGLNTLADSGFEGRTHGNSLDASIWTVDAGAACTYDNTKGGVLSGTRDLDHSKMQVKVVGAPGAYAGFKNVTSMGLTADWAEYRFWVLHPDKTAGNYRAIVSNDAGTNQAFYLFFRDTGAVEVYTEIAGVTGYTQNNFTQVSTFNADEWWQYRLVFLFSEKRYYLYRRQYPTDAWTALKASGASDYKIPFRTSAASEVRYALYLNYTASSVSYVDDIQYQNSPISDVHATILNQVLAIDANDERTAEDDPAGTWYVWGRHLEATYLDSNAPSTYYGGSLTHRAGVNASGHKYHLLLKFFEGALAKGTVSGATLNLYLEDNGGLGAETTLKSHKLLTWGTADAARTYVRTGWGLQPSKSLPTWTNRMYDFVNTEAAYAWQAGGAVGDDEVDLDDPDAPSLTLGAGAAVGYKAIALPAAWLSAWLGDSYSQGIVIKAASEASGSDRYALFGAPSRINSPVLEVTYTAHDALQVRNRKLSTHTFTYGTFATQNRYATVPSDHTFGTVGWMNADFTMSLALVSPEGRIALYDQDTAPPSGFNTYTGGICFGIERDHEDGTFWLGGSAGGSQYMAVGYSREPNLPNRFTWKENTNVTGVTKSSLLARAGTAFCVVAGGNLRWVTYSREPNNSWSAAVTLVNQSQDATYIRGLASGHGIASGDPMTGSGELWLNGTLVGYPAFGSITIGSEIFWYTGKDDGNNKLTGVTRAIFGTTAADHSVGATVNMNRGPIMYSAIHYTEAARKFHVAYTVSNGGSQPVYCHSGYLNHSLDEADTVWRNEAGTALSLPLAQTTERIVTATGKPGYVTELLLTNQGHVLIGSSNVLDLSGMSYSRAYLKRLASGESSFDEIDMGAGVAEMGLIDMGGANVYQVGLQFSGDDSVTVIYRSADGGASWAGPDILSTNTFGVGALWCLSVSQEKLFDVGLLVTQHFAPFGALYLNGAGAFTGLQVIRLLSLPAENYAVLRASGRALPVEFSGAVRQRFRLPADIVIESQVLRRILLAADVLAGIGSGRRAMPVEWDGDRELIRRIHLAAELLGEIRAAARPLPVEWSLGLLTRIAPLPAEVLAEARLRSGFPVEWSGDNIVLRRIPLSAEWTAVLIRRPRLPAEWSGVETGIVDAWNVLRKVSSTVLDEWLVVRTALLEQLTDEWSIRQLLGATLTDSWRVLPNQLLALFSEDIQLPVGSAEKS